MTARITDFDFFPEVMLALLKFEDVKSDILKRHQLKLQLAIIIIIMDTGLIMYVLDKAAQCEDTSLFLDWSVLDTHVLHVATSQCCIANFCDYFQ